MVVIEGSHHITFKGFEINGRETLDSNANVTNIGAGLDTNGLTIIPRKVGSSAVPSHHITLDSLIVHHLGAGGIISYINTDYPSVGNDYITISNCEIYNTNQTSQYRGSAISLLGDVNYDNNSGWHSIIQNNRIHDNVNHNKDTIVNANGETVIDPFKHSDGNGIIIDTQLSTGPSTLIQSNLVYRNGGRGIHVFLSGNVTVVNNTLYYNSIDPYLQDHPGELTAGAAQNVFFSNNIANIAYVQVAPGREVPVAFRAYNYSGGPANSNILFKNNTFTNGNPTPDWNSNADDKYSSNDAMDWNTTIYHNPSWGNLFYNAANGDFRLNLLATRQGLNSQQSQTARNRGSRVSGEYAWYDFLYTVNRSVGSVPGGAVDRGAYEQ